MRRVAVKRSIVTLNELYGHRGALRGTPGCACPQPEPNATELPSCTPISARAAQRWRRRRVVAWERARAHVSTVPTATATGPAAPTKSFERSKSAWRGDEETVD